MNKSKRKNRRLIKRQILRLLVTAVVYMGMMLGVVLLFFAGIWIWKNTDYGCMIIIASCLTAGGGLFLQFSREEGSKKKVCHRACRAARLDGRGNMRVNSSPRMAA